MAKANRSVVLDVRISDGLVLMIRHEKLVMGAARGGRRGYMTEEETSFNGGISYGDERTYRSYTIANNIPPSEAKGLFFILNHIIRLEIYKGCSGTITPSNAYSLSAAAHMAARRTSDNDIIWEAVQNAALLA